MVFEKGVLKICCKFTGEHPCRSVISIKLQRKKCSENMQQIYKKTPMPKCCRATLLKSHFGMGVLLQICCIFSKHLFLGTPLGGCFWSYYCYIKLTTHNQSLCAAFRFSNRIQRFTNSNCLNEPPSFSMIFFKYVFCFKKFPKIVGKILLVELIFSANILLRSFCKLLKTTIL